MLKKILVIEDDPDIREVISVLLSIEGFEVVSSPDGQDGLDYLHSAATLPDVILLDLVMPVKDGYQFRREQIQDERLSNIPVIVMTANQMSDPQAFAGVAFLRKPVALDQLISSIRRVEG